MVIAYLSAGQHGQAILTMALLTISMTSPPLIDRLACLFPSLQRGAGTELVVEMQDLLNVTPARAVLGRGIVPMYKSHSSASPDVSTRRHVLACHPGVHTCVAACGRWDGGENSPT